MAEVTVIFNRQSYHLACKDGEGDRLIELAAQVDEKATSLARSMGAVSDVRLLLMTAILLADELDEAQNGRGRPKSSAPDRLADMQKIIAQSLHQIDDMTRRLESD